MLTIIIAVLVFCLLISTHEFGHFITAKMFGVTVHEFAIGMGPAIFKKQGKETLYSIRIIPVGGYCKMEGEDEQSQSERAFNNKNRLQRIIILAAGAVMNILTGFILFVIIMFQASTINVPIAADLVKDFPAEQVLNVGDEILKVNGTRVYTNSELSNEIMRNGTETAELTVKSGGEIKTVSFAPKADENGRIMLGIVSAQKDLNFGNRFFYAYRGTVSFAKMILVSVGDLITGKVGLNNLSGPAGIVKEIGSAAQTSQQNNSAVPLLTFVAFIAINLGVFNLLPVPALDGGRIFFVLISAIIRRDIPPEKEGMVHFVGLLLLFGLVIYATGNDITRIFKS